MRTSHLKVYPEYVTEFGKRLGKDLLSRQGAQPHVVRQLQLHFEQLIRFHKLLLDEFSSRLDNWYGYSIGVLFTLAFLQNAQFLL